MIVKRAIWSLGSILTVIILFFLLSCNKNEIKCEGCDKDTPWSNSESSYCFPTEDACIAATEHACEKCR
jgi:hypothetical protein